MEAQDQLGQGCLAGTGAPEQAEGLAGLELEVDIGENISIGIIFVLKGDMVEPDLQGAAQQGNTGIITILLDKGADPSIANEQG